MKTEDTCTVGELIEALGKFSPDTRIMAEWETQFIAIKPDRLYMAGDKYGGETFDFLVLDVDDY